MSLLPARRVLLTTTTGEPMQPVRLYYLVPPGSRVRRRLESIRSVERHPRAPLWGWWHRRDAAALDFSRFAATAQPSRVPVMLGTLTFPHEGAMEIWVRSYHRAWLAACFFAPRLGREVALTRVRMLNRLVTASEVTDGPDEIDALLDRNVVIKDPDVEAADARWHAMLAERAPDAGPPALDELDRLCGEAVARRRVDDLPEVEDFRLHPEEETPTFTSLKVTLDLRFLRAMHHWRGRTELSLTDLILEMAGMTDRAAELSTTIPP